MGESLVMPARPFTLALVLFCHLCPLPNCTCWIAPPFIHRVYFACFVHILAFLLVCVPSAIPRVIPSFYGCVTFFQSLPLFSLFIFTHPVLPCTVSPKHSCVHKLHFSLPVYCLFLSTELKLAETNAWLSVIVPANRAWAVVPAGLSSSWLPQCCSAAQVDVIAKSPWASCQGDSSRLCCDTVVACSGD